MAGNLGSSAADTHLSEAQVIEVPKTAYLGFLMRESSLIDKT
jgi:hypothetical protein